MIAVKVKFYTDDNTIYEENNMEFDNWKDVLKYGENHSDALMEIHNLEIINWTYNTERK